MKKKLLPKFIISIILISCCIGCSKITKVTDIVTNPSAREVYERTLKDSLQVFSQWKNAYASAQQDSLEINLPYTENGKFRKNSFHTYSYNFEVKEGSAIIISVAQDTLPKSVFISVFQQQDSIFKEVTSNQPTEKKLEFTPETSGNFKVIIQPELANDNHFSLILNTKPQYGFPVAGKGNKAIQSFWGNARDGGKRKHEGIDIFAKRGTPVVAAVDGRVSSTGNRGLGGKQVWLRDGLFGKSLYYAHLDSILATSGQRVYIGDTLGFVGNTGNAKYTPPHLHFGIYKGYGGAIDPLPFVFKTEEISHQFTEVYESDSLRIKSSKANVRVGPKTSFEKITSLERNDIIFPLGTSDNWIHFKNENGLHGYVHASLVSKI
ncbi:Murein DD-endopeptidase MepM and murein hydrolase activator NlpD, contain LysM domain [Pustulibacterium marinum]|uniref:Murein DD-endopeptidase MepM and murein hydrolase activator NlpD, contain LysM domain n=1 Tax=Pustulibacterium marinum TaxID=1224947 RepID=A0A1I7HFA3_9FLAO|nr:M23 family metallopeptidase [Pustulibacterium marinum]SFU59403.1 Murein DD-endopeptidase MepM and murein hydrolase activator NlpD, contain LysM domain [Pustulibacterium marinum]